MGAAQEAEGISTRAEVAEETHDCSSICPFAATFDRFYRGSLGCPFADPLPADYRTTESGVGAWVRPHCDCEIAVSLRGAQKTVEEEEEEEEISSSFPPVDLYPAQGANLPDDFLADCHHLWL